jgi:type VI secretion system protein ImpM
MLGWKKQVKSDAFVLGKFPGHPEFLRAADDVGAALDAWIDAGWQRACATHGAAWEPAFASGAIYGFVWNPGVKSDQVACGVIAPSSDSIGRPYPLVVARPVAAGLLSAGWPFVPTAAGNLLDGAYSIIVDARSSALALGDLESRLRDLGAPAADEYQAAEAEHTAWCHDVTIDDGWRAVFDESGGREAIGASLDGLADALSPWVKRERPTTSVYLRLPLGVGGSAVATLWLDVVRRIGRWKQTIPSVFWAVESGTMLLTIAPPGPTMIRELWHPDASDEHVFDLAAVSVDETSTTPVSRFLADHPGAAMSDLLSIVGA